MPDTHYPVHSDSITIYRDFPVINGMVRSPVDPQHWVPVDDLLDAIDGSEVRMLSPSIGNPQYSGGQHILRLPGLQPGARYDTNFMDFFT